MTDNLYYDTLADALNAVKDACAKQQAEAYWPDFDRRFANNYCLYVGCSARETFELVSYRGKETRKCLHVNLYRMHSGRYELNHYIL